MTIVLYPYPRLTGAVDVDTKVLAVDGAQPALDVTDVDRRTGDLSMLGPNWNEVILEVTVTGPTSELSELDPVEDLVDAIVSTECQRTELRSSSRADRSGVAHWQVHHRLTRSELVDAVELRVDLVATVDGVANRRIASAEPWKLWVDQPSAPAVQGAIDIGWVDFRSDERPSCVAGTDAKLMFIVDLDGSAPKLWLNSAVDGLAALLDDTRRRPATESAARNALLQAIGVGTWSALIGSSLNAVWADEDSVMWPTRDWQKMVLQRCLPYLLPDESEADQALIRLHQAISGDDPGWIESRIQPAVQHLAETASVTPRIITSLEDEQ